jgi:hypothetical protein
LFLLSFPFARLPFSKGSIENGRLISETIPERTLFFSLSSSPRHF